MKNTIGVTIGDPKGIGPEIVAKAWRALSERERSQLVIYGDHAAIMQAAEMAKIEFDQRQLVITSSTTPPIQKIEDVEAARLTISAIDAAMADAASGKISALVTAPVNKRRLSLARPGFMGHTEYLAKAARIKDVVMMLAYANHAQPGTEISHIRQLCCSLVTTHVPMKELAPAITTDKVLTAIRQTHTAMDKYFACPDARIAVLSLNPHGGEAGILGNEEKTAISPAVERALKEGINCVGPLPAGGVFGKLKDFDYDAVVAMYHDQAIIPMKILFANKCVNISLGLPYIRTSPAHGTAEDIAWLGNADESGMLAAISMARRLLGWKIEA
jgi:4-hydroxythreonine-4-phosphate dehydrogenase